MSARRIVSGVSGLCTAADPAFVPPAMYLNPCLPATPNPPPCEHALCCRCSWTTMDSLVLLRADVSYCNVTRKCGIAVLMGHWCVVSGSPHQDVLTPCCVVLVLPCCGVKTNWSTGPGIV